MCFQCIVHKFFSYCMHVFTSGRTCIGETIDESCSFPCLISVAIALSATGVAALESSLIGAENYKRKLINIRSSHNSQERASVCACFLSYSLTNGINVALQPFTVTDTTETISERSLHLIRPHVA